MITTVEIGKAIVYGDEHGVEHDALVTQNWGWKGWDPDKPLQSNSLLPDYNWPTSLNIVYVAKDNRKDQYGQQLVHDSSVSHRSTQNVHGRYWRLK